MARLGVLSLLVLGACSQDQKNVVFILVDDLGWMDTAAYGSTFYETPHIDRLAASGVRFTSFYAASPVCSPTRASIMTGRHPARLRITNWFGGYQRGLLDPAPYLPALPLEEVTLGEAFLQAGYVTGYMGKWHLGTAGHMPVDQGFAVMQAVNHAGQPSSYFAPYMNPQRPETDVPDLEGDAEGTYLTDRLTDLGIEFVRENRDRPFMLLLSYYTVHTPLQAKPDLVARYQDKAAGRAPQEPLEEGHGSLTRQQQDHAAYAAMIHSLDEGVGRLLRALDDLDLARNTVVVFTSDNGGLSTLGNRRSWAPTSNRPLRAGKGWLYEGGIRIPLIIRDAQRRPDVRVRDVPGATTDLFPTVLDLAGLALRSADHVDGRSLWRASDEARRPLYWHFPHYHGSGNRPSGAIRSGRYKLVEFFEDGRTELYDLDSDLAESVDLGAALPDTAAQLHAALRRWRQEVGARMPTVRPGGS